MKLPTNQLQKNQARLEVLQNEILVLVEKMRERDSAFYDRQLRFKRSEASLLEKQLENNGICVFSKKLQGND